MDGQQNTLKKLSELLGISISTVSRALKDHPDISVKTKSRVKELAAKLDYEPNQFAVQLRTQQSNVIGVLLPTINNHFYDFFIAAVEEEAVKNGYSIMIMQSLDKLELESSNINVFRRNKIVGLFVSISIQTEDFTAYNKLQKSGVPIIFFDRVPEVGGFNKVCLADKEASLMAAKTILDSGKKNVLALFGHPHLSITKLRYATFKEFFEMNAPDVKVSYSFPEQSEATKLVCLDFFKDQIPDMVFCMGDMILMGVMHAIHETKLKVPEDIAVIGISHGLIPTLYEPKITYIETSGYKLGKLAFKQMYARLKFDAPIEEVILDSILVEGGSI